MKRSAKNETEILGLINKIQDQLGALDKKLDTLISRPTASAAKPSAAVPVNSHQRTMYTAICADCKKECSIPFKPSGERPVYCQDCFSRRKVIKMSGMSVAHKPGEAPSISTTKPQAKKKAVTAPKTITKKKAAPKKK